MQGAVVYPAAAFVESTLAAAKEVWGPEAFVLKDVAIEKALFLTQREPRTVQFILDANQACFEIFSRSRASDKAWTRHVMGGVDKLARNPAPQPVSLEDIRGRLGQVVSAESCYRRFSSDRPGVRAELPGDRTDLGG